MPVRRRAGGGEDSRLKIGGGGEAHHETKRMWSSDCRSFLTHKPSRRKDAPVSHSAGNQGQDTSRDRQQEDQRKEYGIRGCIWSPGMVCGITEVSDFSFSFIIIRTERRGRRTKTLFPIIRAGDGS